MKTWTDEASSLDGVEVVYGDSASPVVVVKPGLHDAADVGRQAFDATRNMDAFRVAYKLARLRDTLERLMPPIHHEQSLKSFLRTTTAYMGG